MQIGSEVCWRLWDKELGDLEFMLDRRDESGKSLLKPGEQYKQPQPNANHSNQNNLGDTTGSSAALI